MPGRPAIELARPEDLPFVAAIELAAARLLVGHAPASVLEEVTALADLQEAQQAGLLWVALDDAAEERRRVVGFAQVVMLAPHRPHLEELDVHPGHGRRGLGSALVRAVCDWARGQGHRELTLTTFREVPFNLPLYRRLGFEELPAEAIPPEVQAIVDDETARGLDPASRAVMVHRLG